MARRRLDGNFPTALARRRVTHADIAAGVDQSAVNAFPFQNLQRFVDAVTHADAAGIQSHVRFEQLGSMFFGIQLQRVEIGRGARLGQQFSIGQFFRSPRSSPEFHQWSDSNVERPVAGI